MRREDFTIRLDEADGPPTLVVTFTGTPETFRDRLDDDGTPREATDLDVAYRRTKPASDEDGVLGVTDRMTGEFIFEAVVPGDVISSLVDGATAPEGGEEPCYRLRIEPGDDEPLLAEKRTLLVYDPDGSLDRGNSLIPGSVEI